jgi:hypothetical protein
MIPPHGIDRNNYVPLQAKDLLIFRSDDFFALISAAGSTNAVRLFGLLALRAKRNSRGRDGIMGTTHVTFGFGCFLLGYSHVKDSLSPVNPAVFRKIC